MFVYVIRDEESDLIKIGVSETPQKRLVGLQTGTVNRLRLVATFSGGRDLEAQLHATFAAARVAGEWFRVRAEEVERAAIAARYETQVNATEPDPYPAVTLGSSQRRGWQWVRLLTMAQWGRAKH
jgi:hypothetical protein